VRRRVVIRYERETAIENKVAGDAKRKLGVLSIKLELKHDNGWQDRLFLIPGGRPLFMEIKRSGEDARELQALRRDVLLALKYDAVVCDNYDDAMAEILKRLKR
jgi:hypothetical protein